MHNSLAETGSGVRDFVRPGHVEMPYMGRRGATFMSPDACYNRNWMSNDTAIEKSRSFPCQRVSARARGQRRRPRGGVRTGDHDFAPKREPARTTSRSGWPGFFRRASQDRVMVGESLIGSLWRRPSRNITAPRHWRTRCRKTGARTLMMWWRSYSACARRRGSWCRKWPKPHCASPRKAMSFWWGGARPWSPRGCQTCFTSA